MKRDMVLVVLVSVLAIVGHEPVAWAADTQPQIDPSYALRRSSSELRKQCTRRGGEFERRSFAEVLCYLERSEVLVCLLTKGVCAKANYRWPGKRDDVVDRILRVHGSPDNTINDRGSGCYWGMWTEEKIVVKVCPDSIHLMHEAD